MKGVKCGLYLAVIGMRVGIGGSGDCGGPTQYRRPGQDDKVDRKDDLLT